MAYSVILGKTSSLLNINNIGYSKSQKITRFGPGVRNSFIIHYVISGKGYFNGNLVASGQGFLITPNMTEHYFSDETNPWEFLWFISDDESIEPLLNLFNANKKTNIFNYSYIDEIKKLSEKVMNINNSVLNSFEMLELFLSVFKYQLEYAEKQNDHKSNAKIYLDAAEKYIKSNIYKPVTVLELTEFLGVSQPYLFGIFKSHYSKSPKQYIIDEKINYAKNLLLNTDMSITAIGNSVGYNDVLLFSKCFKAKTGFSPQNYRKKLGYF